MNNNDKRILELKKQIEIKKGETTKIKRFSPITNCSIELDDIRYNINVLSKDSLQLLVVKLNVYLISAKDLGLEKELIICGYCLGDWIEDIKSKLMVISQRDEEVKLKVMEEKLDKLLSNEKKTELEIEGIADLLGI